MMLVLTRTAGEEICIGPDIRVRVLSLRGGQVRLGIEAPGEVTIHRAELVEAVSRQNAAASQPDAAVLDLVTRSAQAHARPES
ncbi:carbon storage regulator CsrA [bacterium]|nr:carbon storage regulator CsrA [bacterium]